MASPSTSLPLESNKDTNDVVQTSANTHEGHDPSAIPQHVKSNLSVHSQPDETTTGDVRRATKTITQTGLSEYYAQPLTIYEGHSLLVPKREARTPLQYEDGPRRSGQLVDYSEHAAMVERRLEAFVDERRRLEALVGGLANAGLDDGRSVVGEANTNVRPDGRKD